MKIEKSILKIAASLIVGLLSVTAVAQSGDGTGGILVNPVTINVQSLSSSIKLESLQATYGSLCTYHSGIVFPTPKNCGSYAITVPVGADGSIRLPALHKFPGLHGSSSGNYRVSLILEPKKTDPRDQAYFFVLSTYNDVAVKALENFRDVIYIGTMDGVNLNVTVDRKPVTGSDLSQLPNAELMVSVEVIGKTDTVQTPILSTPFSHALLGFENRQYANGTSKSDLKNLKQVVINGGNFAFVGNPADAKIILDVTFFKSDGLTDKIIYRKTVESKIDPEFLKENKNIDLDKATN